MTKDFAQTCGLLLMTLISGCTADHDAKAANASNTSVLSEQTAMVRTVLRNSAAPTPEQLIALQSPELHHAFIHDDVPFELWHVFGFADDGHDQRLAHSTRITRFRVRSDSQDASASSWNFNNVMALESDIVDIGLAKSQASQQVERVALGLSGTDINAHKVWVGAAVIEKLFDSDDASPEGQKEKSCNTRYRLDLPVIDKSTFNVDTAQLSCPDVSVLRSAVQSSANSMATTLTNTITDKKSVGRAWLVQAWGWPLDNDNAAVVFDRAWLVLDDEYEIQLQQTKRRSCKGPKTTTGTRWSIKSDESTQLDEDLALQWTTDHSGSAIQWHIASTSHGVDILVEPIVETALSPKSRWFGPVKITGTHQGLGFIDYQPL